MHYSTTLLHYIYYNSLITLHLLQLRSIADPAAGWHGIYGGESPKSSAYVSQWPQQRHKLSAPRVFVKGDSGLSVCYRP